MSLEPLLAALREQLPGSVRVGDALRLPAPNGCLRVIVPRAAHDPQVDHGLLLGFAPPLEEGHGLDACHLRARVRRSVDAVEAAQKYAAGVDVDEHAHLLAREALAQVTEMWSPFLEPVAWSGPVVESILSHAANSAPADAEPLLAMVRASALLKLDRREDARPWIERALLAVDPRVRKAALLVRRSGADA